MRYVKTKIFLIATFILSIGLLASCDNKQADNTNKHISSKDTSTFNTQNKSEQPISSKQTDANLTSHIGSDDTLFSLFPQHISDSIHIHNSLIKINKNQQKLLSNVHKKIFYNTLKIKSINSTELNHFPLHPIKQISLNEEIIGLITLRMGMYTLSKLDLFLYSLNTEKITYGLELCDNWGDVGISFQKTSWIQDFDNNGQLDILTKQTVFTPITEPYNQKEITGYLRDTLRLYQIQDKELKLIYQESYCDSVIFKSDNTMQRIKEISSNTTSIKDTPAKTSKQIQKYH